MSDKISTWAADHEMVPLNDGSITRFSPTRDCQDTSIDVTFASTSILKRLKWSTYTDPVNSDHVPISVTLDSICPELPVVEKWKIKEADWDRYHLEIGDELLSVSHLNVKNITQAIFETAKRAIPRTTGNTSPKYASWWTVEISQLIQKRKEAWKILLKTLKTDNSWNDKNEKFRKARAEAKTAIVKGKKKSWEEFASSFNAHTPASVIWKRFEKITGKKTYNKMRMTINGNLTEDTHEIANHLADTFQESFSLNNYPETLRRNTFSPPPFIATNEIMDSDFSAIELNVALGKYKSKAAGPDEITYSMITNMAPIAKKIVLNLFNDLWRNGDYPSDWCESRIIPIPKPGDTKGFRPISLTSCMAKIYERMINQRLQHYLEKNKILHKNQHAFRSGRGTTSYLSQLKDILTEHRQERQHSEIVSLDLSKAFDRTWRPGILQALEKYKVGNRTYQMVTKFLCNRTFRVVVDGSLSSVRPQETGVPQGSVISPTLFILVINEVFKVIPKGIMVLIYADDILLICGSKFAAICRKKLQKGIDTIIKWTDKNGFTINAEKSSLLHTCSNTKGRHHFFRMRNLSINGTEIQRKRNARILGINLNQKGNASAHLKVLKKDCEIRIRFLKTLSSLGSRETLMKIGYATVISKLFYGLEIFEPHEILTLKTIYHNMLRTVSGAFYTTPIKALYVENGVLPFEFLVAENWARKAAWIAERAQHSENFILNRANNLLEGTSNCRLPPIAKLRSEVTRDWFENPIIIDWTIKRQYKTGGNKAAAIALFSNLKNTVYPHKREAFTDGSLSNGKVGFGVFSPTENNVSNRLPDTFSIFSAEATAIALAVEKASIPTIIYSDSASVLEALESGIKHPIIQDIQKHRNKGNVTLVWIPSHVGILGNEKADKLANLGREGERISRKTPKADALKWVKHQLWMAHERNWKNEQETTLREIKSSTSKWIDTALKKDQKILTRLRTGHSKITHKHILERTEAPTCVTCGVSITVKHLLMDCRKYDMQRANIFPDAGGGLVNMLKNNKQSEKIVIKFLKQSALYDQI